MLDLLTSLHRLSRLLAAAGMLCLVTSGTVHAQPAAPAARTDAEADAVPLTRCERRAQRNLRRWDRVGDAAVSATRRVGRFVGASENNVGRVLRVGHYFSTRVARRLDCDEQQQAARATDEAIRGGVGTTARWRSETRRNVSGSSTVDRAEALAGGISCLTVTDIIIVEGEELRVPKRMCRRPPSSRYIRA